MQIMKHFSFIFEGWWELCDFKAGLRAFLDQEFFGCYTHTHALPQTIRFRHTRGTGMLRAHFRSPCSRRIAREIELKTGRITLAGPCEVPANLPERIHVRAFSVPFQAITRSPLASANRPEILTNLNMSKLERRGCGRCLSFLEFSHSLRNNLRLGNP